MKLINYCILFFALIPIVISAQSNILNSTTPDLVGVTNVDQKQSDMDSFLDYKYIDDRDILWSKIVYEKIDLNEKLNFPLLFPKDDNKYEETRKSLWRVLSENILNGNITEIYRDDNDNFLSKNKLKAIDPDGTGGDNGFMSKISFVPTINGIVRARESLKSDQITGYIIKGMWYFDKRRGELDYRLLGLKPIGLDIKAEDQSSETVKNSELFWIWYPSIRKILHTALVFNDTSNANQISFDQLLISRRFSSYIFKEDNMYGDRAISAYKEKGLRSILESQRIKKEILDFEQDLWNR